MRCEAGNLIAHSLRWQNGDLIDDTLVCVEIEGQFSVVLLNDSTSTLLNGLCTDTLFTNEEKNMSKTDKETVVVVLNLSPINYSSPGNGIDPTL